MGGRAPLHIAASKNCIGIAELLMKADADSTIQDARGATPLHTASQEGCCDVVRLLMAHGADPHIRDWSGHNAAYWAKAFRHQAVMDWFDQMQVQPRQITSTEMVAHGKMCREYMRGKKKKKKKKKKYSALIKV